jgi:hypothetical protein
MLKYFVAVYILNTLSVLPASSKVVFIEKLVVTHLVKELPFI